MTNPEPAKYATSDRLLGIIEVERITGLSRSTIYRQIGVTQFPKPWRIARRNLWSARDLETWFAARRRGEEQ